VTSRVEKHFIVNAFCISDDFYATHSHFTLSHDKMCLLKIPGNKSPKESRRLRVPGSGSPLFLFIGQETPCPERHEVRWCII